MKAPFIGIMGHTVMNPHGVPGVAWRKLIYKLRKGHNVQLRRGRNG
jgi:hypothetical protein